MTIVESTIEFSAHFDDYLITVAIFFGDDGAEEAGGNRQKRYYETYASFFPKAHNELIACI